MNELLIELQEIKHLLEKPKLKVYTINAATKEFKLGRETLLKGIESGSLKYMKSRSVTYLTEDAIKAFVESGVELI